MNGDGCISRSELSEIVQAIHELMGRRPNQPEDDRKCRDQVGVCLTLDTFDTFDIFDTFVTFLNTGRQGISKVGSKSGRCDNNRRISRGLPEGRSRHSITANVRHRPLMFAARNYR